VSRSIRTATFALALLLTGCPDGGGVDRIPGAPPSLPPIDADALDDDDSAAADDDDLVDDDDLTDDDDLVDDDDVSGPCPEAMALVDDAVCVDRFEAALEELVDSEWEASSPYLTIDGRTVRAVPADGRVPQGYISGDEAAAACAAAGKRLCSSSEWLSACRGPSEHLYPYGDSHQPGACNDEYPGGHPVVDFFGTSDGVWDPTHMNDPGINQQPDTVEPGGAHAGCVSAWGCFDMHGNLHEWVADAGGVFRGGFFADASINGPGCTYATTAHSTGYHDYSTGFRCCADPFRSR